VKKKRQSPKQVPSNLKILYAEFFKDPKAGANSVIKTNSYLIKYAPSIFLPFYPDASGGVPASTAEGWISWVKNKRPPNNRTLKKKYQVVGVQNPGLRNRSGLLQAHGEVAACSNNVKIMIIYK
jgi:hypothetical protein